jgi:acyl carrier protein
MCGLSRSGIDAFRFGVVSSRMGTFPVRFCDGPVAIAEKIPVSESASQIAAEDPIVARIRATLVELFGLEPAAITLEARLLEDLEIDSIDVVDLMDQMRRFTGRKVSAEDFRSVRTVADLATIMRRLQQT